MPILAKYESIEVESIAATIQLPKEHVWQDGPDGNNYHCAFCGISRTMDWSGTTCASHLKTKLKHLFESGITSRNRHVWLRGPKATQATKRPKNFLELSTREQWAIDKRLGLIGWDGDLSK